MKPAMPEDKMENIFRSAPPSKRAPQTFQLGDRVRVRSGPFAAFTGVVAGINQALHLLKVKIEIMGKETPIKLDFVDAEKPPSI